MPVFTAKHNELKLQEQGQSSDGNRMDMLGTIKLPLNMKLLTGKLPGSQYESDNHAPKSSTKKRTGNDSILDEIEEVHEDHDNHLQSAQKR
jgi:hypothetical protein